MLPTPDVSHLSKEDFSQVYEPAEDTYCLLDALEADAEVLRKAKIRLIVEIGCGSGCVSAFISQIIGSTEAAFICTDINPAALIATNSTGKANGVLLSPIRSHLVDALTLRCQGKIDLLIFNPPYVPTSDEEERAAQQNSQLPGSWAGGMYGKALLDELLPQLKELLSDSGLFYLVAIHQNDPANIVNDLVGMGLQASTCFSRRAGREHLYIIRATKGSLS